MGKTSLFKRYSGVIIILLVLFFIFFISRKSIEGLHSRLQQTSCTQFDSCSDCVNGHVNNSNSNCYWNRRKKICGSFRDKGYSRRCPNIN